MKLFRPLKYVLTAAAVCILCFSGNGNYIYAVCDLTADNDIVEQPGELLAEKTLTREKIQNSRLKRYVQLYISKCLAQKSESSDMKDTFEVPYKIECAPAFIQEAAVLKDQLTLRLPGNRSP